ncbi:hypothetical protein pb186bvf_013852 [Paramecium bursaria]
MILFILSLVQGMDFPLIGMNKLLCGCSDYTSESQCTSFQYNGTTIQSGCEWSGSKCTSLTCSSIKSKKACNERKDCAWNAEEVCQKFTSCNTLFYVPKSNNSVCSFKDCSESNKTDSNGNFYCVDAYLGTAVCSQKTSLFSCLGEVEGLSICFWDFAKNLCFALYDCRQFTSSFSCSTQLAQCQWINNQCQPAICENANQLECAFGVTLSFQYGNQSTCLYQNNACTNPTPADLDSNNCRQLSLNTYHWSAEAEQCVKCTYGFMLFLSIILIFN